MMLQRKVHKKDSRFPLWSSAGVLYQVVMDKKRTLLLDRAIASTIKGGEIVVDIGTGCGLLACFAIKAGAKLVYAIESDPSNYKAALTVVKDNHMEQVIKLIHKDALKVKLPEKADIVICELMSTALLDEPQINLMNYAVKVFLKKEGIIIPKKATTFIEYVTTNYFHYGIKLRVPQYEWDWIEPQSQKLSETMKLFEIDFSKLNNEYIYYSGCMKIIREGLLNGVRLTTVTYFTDDIIHDSSMGFCPPLVIPSQKQLTVEKGDKVYFELSYKAGQGYANIELNVSKTKLKSRKGVL